MIDPIIKPYIDIYNNSLGFRLRNVAHIVPTYAHEVYLFTMWCNYTILINTI